jgi:phosphatidylinositol kinase/protein kinase (PI-3  family)
MHNVRFWGCQHHAGYLIGLGDRHSHNILIDQRSADVVHIDLGIAFEQARHAL